MNPISKLPQFETGRCQLATPRKRAKILFLTLSSSPLQEIFSIIRWKITVSSKGEEARGYVAQSTDIFPSYRVIQESLSIEPAP